MPDWLIEIVPVIPTDSGGPNAAFEPSTQQVLAGDNITWTNRTEDQHQPVPVNPKPPSWTAAFGVNPVPPDQSSNPTYSIVAPVLLDPNTGQPAKDANGNTIPIYGPATYQCKFHPNEIGIFDILKVPPTF
jgi:plastocyanin